MVLLKLPHDSFCSRQQVFDEEAKSLADCIGAIYLGTSARTGAGVDTAFMLAAGQLVSAK